MTTTQGKKFLVIGYGNPGRLDDGLGPALALALEKLDLPTATIESDYQLRVEDAPLIAEHDVVVFADASVDGQEPFYVEKIAPADESSFSTHSLQPKALLGMAYRLFGAKTEAYLLGIRGYEFNAFGEKIHEKAEKNLHAAREFLTHVLRQNNEQLLKQRCLSAAAISSTVS